MNCLLSRRQFLSATAGVIAAPMILTPWARAQSAQGLLQLSSPYDKVQLRTLAA